jgi:hypothetical protein
VIDQNNSRENKKMSSSSRLTNFALLVGAMFVATQSNAVVLYQETFPYSTTAAGQDLELRNQGWCGGNAGDAFCNNPPAGSGSNNEGGEGAISVSAGSTLRPSNNVNNNPQGILQTDSFAFWSQTAINADSFLYTNEYLIQSAQLESIVWDTRDSTGGGVGNQEHLAFLIGDDWYISDQFWINTTNMWTTVSVDLVDLTFFVRSFDGTTLPGGGLPATSPNIAMLPDADIRAFGVWWDGPKNKTSRIDNFTLNGRVPAPATLALLGLGLAAIGYQRKRIAAA